MNFMVEHWIPLALATALVFGGVNGTALFVACVWQPQEAFEGLCYVRKFFVRS